MYPYCRQLTSFQRYPTWNTLCYVLFFLLISVTTGNSQTLDTELTQRVTEKVPMSSSPAPNSELSLALEKHLVCQPIQLIQNEGQLPILSTEDLCLATIYHETGAQPLWVTTDGPSEKAEILLKYLTDSDQHGLEPNGYKIDRLGELWSSKDINELVEIDLLLTYNIVKYVHDISHGQLKPLESDPQLFPEAGDTAFNPLRTIEILLTTNDLDKFLASLPPQHQHYNALKTALADYRNLAEHEEWPQVEKGASIRPGDENKRIIAIRERLQFVDPSLQTPEDSDATQYDPMLQQAVRSFQRIHSLKKDGIIGKNTITALNISIAEKIEMIRLNMMRWRWQAHDLEERYVLVNIASFNLKAFQDQDIVLDVPIIVGTTKNETPVFSSHISYIEFHPFWNIPTSIAQNETLPALRENTQYLIEHNITLFSSWREDATELDSTSIDWEATTPSEMATYKLRQEPGPWNALGKVKFMFPNGYSVYIHDTASRNLFALTNRNFSHGCVRVSDPLGLAIFLLKNPAAGWDTERIKEIYEQEERKIVTLPTPIAVYITYGTVWVDKDHEIHFSKDVYLRDERLRNALLK